MFIPQGHFKEYIKKIIMQQQEKKKSLRMMSLKPSPSYSHLQLLHVHVDEGVAEIFEVAVGMQYSAAGYGLGK